jgi:DNA-binding Xre family transcriptional regulator
MTRPIADRVKEYQAKTRLWDQKPRKPRKKAPGRKPQYHFKPIAGKWRLLLLQKCRETGYVHTQGPHAGNINFYRLEIETGLRRTTLYKILKSDTISMDTLGRLCDVFHCQPNDFVQRISQDVPITSAMSLPESMQEDDLPGDEYVRPSDL